MSRERPSILLVDDDESVAVALVRLLKIKIEDLECVIAPDGLTAYRMLGQRSFDLLVTDMAMGGMNGTELLRLARERWPEMRRVLFTGFADASVVTEQEDVADRVLGKPGDIHALVDTLCHLASTPRASSSEAGTGTETTTKL